MEETTRLFDTDSYLTEFDGAVTACSKVKEGYGVVLDRTAFFPEEGGQGCDTGELDGQAVLHVSIKDNIITHIVREPIEAGRLVHGSICWENRFSNMQQHSGEHIVSGLIHARFGFDNVGFHLGSSAVTLDFNGTFTDSELEDIERSANEVIVANRKVEVSFPGREELSRLEYRSKKELQGQVRIVKIDGVDVCACCAPHVSLTGEIGVLKFVDAQHFRGGTRISMLCGFRALNDYRFKQSQQKQLSVMLSAKPEAVVETVEKLKDDCGSCKYELIQLQGKLMGVKLEALQSALCRIEEKEHGGACNDSSGGDGRHIVGAPRNAADYDLWGTRDGILKRMGIYCIPGRLTVIFEDKLESLVMRDAVNRLTELYGGYMAVFSGSGGSYNYIAGSRDRDCRELLGLLRDKLQAKGGGRPEMIQGSVCASAEHIAAVLISQEISSYEIKNAPRGTHCGV